MTVRELRQLLFNIEDQEAQIKVLAEIEYKCDFCGDKEKFNTDLEFLGMMDGQLLVSFHNNY